MIIKTPTGLYSSAIPHKPQDHGNVTFTISNTDPPRTSLLFPKLPPGVSDRKRTSKSIDLATRRADVDNLIYTIQKSGRASLGTSTRQYEVGEILEFGDLPVRTLDPFTPGMESEIRHDTGLIDYARLGLTTNQVELIQLRGQLAYIAKQRELLDARQRYDQLQTDIQENQKLITESGKALDALLIIGVGDPQILAMVNKLTENKTLLMSARGGLMNRANDLARVAVGLLNELRELAMVVR